MRHNYEAIGGRSPLTDLTFAQGSALQARLGPDIPVVVGMRNWKPFLADAVAELARGGVTRVIAIPLAPQFSTLSVAKDHEAAAAAMPAAMELVRVDSFHTHPALVEAFAERIEEAGCAPDEELIFHRAQPSPARHQSSGDRYATEVAETSRAIAARLGLTRYRRAFQSAGRSPEPWIALDLGEFLRHRASRGATKFLIVPIRVRLRLHRGCCSTSTCRRRRSLANLACR
ncbi:MAG: ferrochelatase [Vicinamibacterales bacterium]